MSRKVTLIARDPAGFKQACLLLKETSQYYHVSIIAEAPGYTGFEVGEDVLRLKRGDYRIM